VAQTLVCMSAPQLLLGDLWFVQGMRPRPKTDLPGKHKYSYRQPDHAGHLRHEGSLPGVRGADIRSNVCATRECGGWVNRNGASVNHRARI
jgi:hypothetical protein